MLTSKIAFRELFGGYKKLMVFYICVFLSVFVIITVEQLSKNIQNKIFDDAKIIFGGDISVTNSNYPLDLTQQNFLKKFGDLVYTAELRGMLSTKEKNRLVEIKGVDDNYPLFGKLTTKFNYQLPIKDNEAFISQELEENFNLKVGDEITLSGKKFTVADVIISEPDWIITSFMIGPRVMTNVNSLSNAGLLQPGNLVKYAYRIKLNSYTSLEEAESRITKELPYALTKNYNSGTSVIQNSVSRLEFFLMLAAISNLLICGIGIAVSSKRFLESKLTNIAILKSIGATRKQVILTYSQILGLLTLDASIFASILSTVTCYFLVPYLNNFIDLNLEYTFFLRPIFFGILFGIISTFTFSIPALLSSADVHPASLFRSTSGLSISKSMKNIIVYCLFGCALILLILINAHDFAFAWRYLLGSIGFIILFFGVAKLIQRIASKFQTSIPWLNLSIKNLYRPQSPLPTIVVSISLALSVLISINTVEHNFKTLLNENIPQKAPSLFLLDVSKEQLNPLINLFKKYNGVSDIVVKPSIQGLITHVKSIPVDKANIDSSAQWSVNNHRRLSYSNLPPDNNLIVDGKWWSEGYIGDALVSLDKKIFDGMHLQLGDELTFNILGKEIKAKVANTRKVDYSSFNINFAVIFSPNVIEQFPLSYFATLKIENQNDEFKIISDISDSFPTIVSIRTQDGLKIASKQISNIIIALNIIVLISIISGFIVLVGAFLATEESRKYDTIVFKMLGSNSKYILRSHIFEWSLCTLISCFVAIFAGTFSGYLILKYLSDFEFYINYKSTTYILGITFCVVVSTVSITNYRVLRTKPSEILRNE